MYVLVKAPPTLCLTWGYVFESRSHSLHIPTQLVVRSSQEERGWVI